MKSLNKKAIQIEKNIPLIIYNEQALFEMILSFKNTTRTKTIRRDKKPNPKFALLFTAKLIYSPYFGIPTNKEATGKNIDRTATKIKIIHITLLEKFILNNQ